MEIPIKDFYQRILGWVSEDSSGNKTVRDFYRRIVARYDKRSNTTRDEYGRILGQGDFAASLLFSERK